MKNKNLLTYLIGVVIVILLFIPIYNFQYGIVLKYDYAWAHIPSYSEFFNLLNNGIPLWSWNFFLGLNYWGSKSIGVVGDVFVWLTYLINIFINSIVHSMSIMMIIKFIIGYSGFYLLSIYFTKKLPLRLISSLFFIFSGWSTTFIEQTFFTSFYVILPFMFYGLEEYISKKKSLIFIISIVLLISIDFYLFWPAAILLLIYWIYRYIVLNDNFDIKKFIQTSFILLGFALIALTISAIIWLPGIQHLLSSTRLGHNLVTYNNWSLTNISSFFVFSFIPVLKYLDGFLKDDWYYFNQIGLYFGVLFFISLPQVFFVFKSKKEKIINIIILCLMYLLLISPKIGFIFHFTYSIRYTFIITFMALIISLQIIDRVSEMNKKALVTSFIVVMSSYLVLIYKIIPDIYGDTLPKNLTELSLINLFIFISTIYYILLFLLNTHSITKNKRLHSLIYSLLIATSLVELSVQASAALKSQDLFTEYSIPPYEQGEEYLDAVNYLKEYDGSFYRIFQDNYNLSNINLVYDFKSISTYDSTYQYSQSRFLQWARQYPNINWEFRFGEPAVNLIMDTRYAIVKSDNDSYMSSDWYTELIYDNGTYKVLKYKQEVGVAFTYNSIDSYETLNEFTKGDNYQLFEVGEKLQNTIYLKDPMLISEYKEYVNHSEFARKYFDPIAYSQNYMAFDIHLKEKQIVFFSIPIDNGWTITNSNNEPVEYFEVQGGFIGIALNEGDHFLEFKYRPSGFISGLIISGIGVLLLIVYEFLFKRLKSFNKF